jgi:hypothetical protein
MLASLALLDCCCCCCKAAPTSDKTRNKEGRRESLKIRRKRGATADERHPTPQNSSFKIKIQKQKNQVSFL